MLQLFEYDLPFRSPFITGSAEYKSRKGILIHYKNSRTDVVAEAAPLPGFSKESFNDVKQSLSNQQEFIQKFLEDDLTLQKIWDLEKKTELNYPSVQFALSYLSLSVLAEKHGKTIYDLFKTIPAGTIEVNDVIGHSKIEGMRREIEESVQRGFKVIKVKALHPVGKLASLLAQIQRKYPSIRFRLDANQSWPVSSLEKNCGQFRNLRIQYIEEPVFIEKPETVRNLQNRCSIPIALDETVNTLETLKNILKEYPDVYVIIKPMLLGNILSIHETISQFRGSFKQIVCTTALESSIGRSMVATTAYLTCDQNLSHGLNTGHLFATDLLPDLEIENGSLKHLHKNTGTRSFQGIKTAHLKKLG